MQKFAVAFISFFNHELTIVFVEAFDEVEAALQILHNKAYDTGGFARNLEGLKKDCFDCDCMIDVKALP